MAYDEQFAIARVGPTFYGLYQQAGRVWGDDPDAIVWGMRTQTDIDVGKLAPEASLAKHAAECRAALGLAPVAPIDPKPIEPPPAGPLAPLTADPAGLHENGRLVLVRGVTAFAAPAYWKAGELARLRAYADWTRSLVPAGVVPCWRIFLRWSNSEPSTRSYVLPADAVGEFAAAVLELGIRPWLVYFTDQVSGSAVVEANPQSYLDRALEALGERRSYCLHEASNEDWKNGEVVRRLTWPDRALAVCTSSPPDGTAIPAFADGWRGNVGNIHTPRDAEAVRKFKNLYEYSYQVQELRINGRCLAGEPARTDEWDAWGRGTLDMQEYAAGCDLMGGGMILHAHSLKACQPSSHAGIAATSTYWRSAAALAADVAYTARYTRGGPAAPAPCPLEHDDATCLRTFAMLYDSQPGSCLRVRDTVGPTATNGYAIVGSWAGGVTVAKAY